MRENSELYHVDVNGKATKLDYKAIGIGDGIADVFCKKLILNGRPKIKEFVKKAYTAITYMERFCLAMGVGIGEDIPKIKYLYYNKDDDYEEIPSPFIEECKNHANDELSKMTEAFEALKRLYSKVLLIRSMGFPVLYRLPIIHRRKSQGLIQEKSMLLGAFVYLSQQTKSNLHLVRVSEEIVAGCYGDKLLVAGITNLLQSL